MDWKDALGSLLADPSLPAGEEAPDVQPEQTDKKAGRPQSEPVRLFKERKGRGGKTALIVEGFLCNEEDLADLAGWLKKKLGVGGSARQGEILIQGDCADRLRALLSEKGYQVKG